MFKRLLDSFKPSDYQISLDINRDTSSFTGSIIINGLIANESSSIQLHSKNLVINSAMIDEVPVSCSHEAYDVLSLSKDQGSLGKGDHVIKLVFTGRIQTEAMHGIYESRFEHEGQLKKIIVTQFESHHAREAFPCIDEPEAKATFQLTLTTPEGEPALSNTPSKDSSVKSGRLTTVFEKTPIMSTYLFAFAFGDMHCVEGKTKDGVVMRTWASTAQPKSWLEYSLNEGIRILEFFTEYFDTPFPLKKCDQIALPDFDAGAMENWGMVTYREIALLSDPDNRSVSTEQYVSLVVAHELSHQWFGNLVTMKWWDDLWLNESFASMMEHLALDALHPDWHQWEDYTASDVVSTSNRDIFSDVQAVRVEVDNPELIETLFDPAIVYAKGGRLLKMLREYIGDKAFKAGLKEYFTLHAYKNTTRDDLWQSLAKSSGKDIHALMNPWLEQSGMPLLTVTQSGKTIGIEQERFVLDTNNDPSLWVVPLLANHPLSSDEITDKVNEVTSVTGDYAFFNQRGSGHYLVKYKNTEHMQAIVTQLQKQSIPTEGKINLFNDQLLLSKRGDVSIVDALDLVLGNSDESRESVWSLMGMTLGVARSFVDTDDELELNLKQLSAELMRTHYDRLGWTSKIGEDPNDSHLRVTAVAYMIAGRDRDAVSHALKLYTKNSNNLDRLPADLRSVILSCAVRNSDEHDSVISNLLKQYQTTASADVQLDITSALCSTKVASDVDRYIKEALGSEGFVRQQDFIRWLAILNGNKYTRDAIWDFFETDWDYVKKQLNGSKSYDYFPIYAARGLNTDTWKQRFEQFFTPKLNEPVLERNIHVALKDIQARIDWRKRDEPKVIKWLKQH